MSDDAVRVYLTPEGEMVVPWRVNSRRYGHLADLVWRHDGEVIELLTPEQFHALPDGILLISIMGDEQRKGPDWTDFDTRGGRMAWGVPDRRTAE